MTTVIMTKLGDGEPPAGGQGAYAVALTKYMDSPEKDNPDAKEQRIEKCVAMANLNLPREDMSSEEVADYMTSLLAKSKHLGQGNGIDHWVMSWNSKKGELPPSVEACISGVTLWAKEMGYEQHMIHIAIHDDTAHRHAHVAVCRMDLETGKVKPRGFWKRENQKALINVAATMGWDIEGGTKRKFMPKGRPRLVAEPDRITGCPQIRRKQELEEIPQETQKDKYPGLGAARCEQHAGLKSDTRILREKLLRVYDEIRDEIPSMKWGQIHNRLAAAGLQMERREHRDKKGNVKFGLVFSMDGEKWASASVLGIKELQWKALSERVGKSWRAANDKAREILRESRERESGEDSKAKAQWEVILADVAKLKVQMTNLEKRIQDLQHESMAAARERAERMMRRLIREIESFPIAPMFSPENCDCSVLGNLVEALFKFTEAGAGIVQLANGKRVADRRTAEINARTFDVWIEEGSAKLEMFAVTVRRLQIKVLPVVPVEPAKENGRKVAHTESCRIQQRDRAAVPLRDYEEFQAYLERMERQEREILSIREFAKSLKISHVSAFIRETGLKIQSAILADADLAAEKERKNLGKGFVDFRTARGLYTAGATPDEVASFLAQYGMRSSRLKPRPYGNVRDFRMRQVARRVNPKEDEQEARLTAARAMPPAHYSGLRAGKRRDDETSAMAVIKPKSEMPFAEAFTLMERQKHLEKMRKGQLEIVKPKNAPSEKANQVLRLGM